MSSVVQVNFSRTFSIFPRETEFSEIFHYFLDFYFSFLDLSVLFYKFSLSLISFQINRQAEKSDFNRGEKTTVKWKIWNGKRILKRGKNKIKLVFFVSSFAWRIGGEFCWIRSITVLPIHLEDSICIDSSQAGQKSGSPAMAMATRDRWSCFAIVPRVRCRRNRVYNDCNRTCLRKSYARRAVNVHCTRIYEIPNYRI